MSILLLILGLILFVALVVVHEFGHFIIARRNGVEVEEFGIGFPPRAMVLGRKKGTTYTLNWLPLGGFVRLKGEHDADKEKGSFGAAKLGAKSRIMLAGVVMNLATAYVLLVILALAGMPKLVDNQYTVARDTKTVKNEVFIGYIEPGSPAEKASSKPLASGTNEHLQVRDQIKLIRGFACGVDSSSAELVNNPNLFKDTACLYRIDAIKQVHEATTHLSGVDGVIVTVDRDGRLIDIYSKLRGKAEVEASQKTDNPKGYLGIAPTEYTLQRSTWSAPIVAGGLIKQFTVLTFQGLGKALGGLFSGNTAQASEQVSGPVGIFVLLKDGSLLGYQFILTIIAIISLTLAIMNALPIPALDGGRLFVMWLFRAIRRPLTRRREELIHGTGFALLMVLFVLITIVDVKRNF